MKDDAARGALGAWAIAAREHAGYPSSQAAAEAARAQGISVKPTYLRGIEAGTSHPSRALVLRLAEFYGVTPPPDELLSRPDPRLEAQQAMVAEVVSELGPTLRSQQEQVTDAVAQLGPRLERLERLLERQAQLLERLRRDQDE